MRSLNIGQVGYKFMGKAHSFAYRNLAAFFPDVAARPVMKVLCGRDAEWVGEAAGVLGWQEVVTDYKELVKRDDVDVIDITAPSNAHKDIALAAAAAGKHIFCEKPLALNVADAREMLAAVRSAGVRHMVGFNYRFAPAVLLAKQLIDQGKIGKVFHFRGCFLQDWIIDSNFPKVWRLDKEVCGSGSLGDLGAHVIDCARFLVGEFESVIGESETFVKERPVVERMTGLSGAAAEDAPREPIEVDDGTVFIARFKNGALGMFEATRFAAGHKNNMYFEINGERGSIKFIFERMNELQYYNREDDEATVGFRVIQASAGCHPYMQAWWPTGHVIGYENTFVHEMYEFMQAIATGCDTAPNFEDGVKCAQILEAVEQSITQRSWCMVDSI